MNARWIFVAGATVATVALGCEDKPSPAPQPTGTTSAATSAKAPAGSSAPVEGAEPGLPQDLPHELGKVRAPADNAMSDAKVKLGHQLFFDTRLSADGSRSCYSCHQNEHGNGGEVPLAVGAKEAQLTRHSPVIWNVGYLPELYWDGRAKSLEAQATGAWSGGNMGVGKDGLDAKAKEIGAIAGYKKQFDEVFPDEGVTPDTIAKAISAYERTLVCDDTAYDKFAKGDPKALTDQQKAGLRLFLGKAACSVCHAPPFFSTAYGESAATYFNVGVGASGKEEDVDVGRQKISEQESDWAAFKTPTLRNISKSAPYFHDGSVATLKEAVTYMATGGAKNKNLSALIQDRKLSAEEIDSIVAFLGALDCGKQLEEPELP